MLKLEPQPVQQLLKSPETGMGYQTVQVTTRSGAVKTGIAYNADLVLFEDEARGPLDRTTYQSLIRAAKSSDGDRDAGRCPLCAAKSATRITGFFIEPKRQYAHS